VFNRVRNLTYRQLCQLHDTLQDGPMMDAVCEELDRRDRERREANRNALAATTLPLVGAFKEAA
jgi:hypothetical protein